MTASSGLAGVDGWRERPVPRREPPPGVVEAERPRGHAPGRLALVEEGRAEPDHVGVDALGGVGAREVAQQIGVGAPAPETIELLDERVPGTGEHAQAPLGARLESRERRFASAVRVELDELSRVAAGERIVDAEAGQGRVPEGEDRVGLEVSLEVGGDRGEAAAAPELTRRKRAHEPRLGLEPALAPPVALRRPDPRTPEPTVDSV